MKPDACGIIQSGLAVVLDMDGVIIHSNPVHRVAWERFNARYGLATTEAMHERMYGKRNDEIIRDFYGDLGEEEIRRRGAAKEELYRSLVAGGLERHLVPGLRKFLHKLGNTPVGLGTNAERPNVDFLLDGAGIRRFFCAVVDGGQVAEPKPSPEVYLRVAERMGVDPRNCIVFEDSYSGVAAARAAGARVVGVRTTHRELPGVDLAIDDFESNELWPWLTRQQPRA